MTVYIKVNDTTCVNKPTVHLKDIAAIYCTNKDMEEQLKKLPVFKFRTRPTAREVISTLYLVEKIKEVDKNLEVENFGSSDFIVYLKEKKTEKAWVHRLKIFFVALVSFFGATFSIMAYNTDVGIEELFFRIYALIMGKNPTGPTILHVCYSIGLSIGILVFFNHVGKMKLSKEPTPFQIQMKLYEKDLNDSIIMETGQGKEEIDVDL